MWTHKYDPNGRSQDESGSNLIHEELTWYMRLNSIGFTLVDSHDRLPRQILKDLVIPK